jgi:hypothetical protein
MLKQPAKPRRLDAHCVRASVPHPRPLEAPEDLRGLMVSTRGQIRFESAESGIALGGIAATYILDSSTRVPLSKEHVGMKRIAQSS